MNNYSKLLQHRLLSKEETYSLITSYQSSDDPLLKKTVIEKLIKYNYKLIYNLATKFVYSHSNCELDDAIQVVSLSLIRTVEKFDCSLDLEFSTYLYTWSRSYLQRYYQKAHRAVRLPAHIQEDCRIIKKFINNFEFQHARRPSLSEISDGLKLSVEKIETCLLATRPISSLNKTVGNSELSGGHITELIDVLEQNENYSPDDYLNSQLQIEGINNLLEILEPADQELLKMKYNLTNELKSPTLNEISNEFGITREAVRGKINKIINTLRKSKEVNNLKYFL